MYEIHQWSKGLIYIICTLYVHILFLFCLFTGFLYVGLKSIIILHLEEYNFLSFPLKCLLLIWVLLLFLWCKYSLFCFSFCFINRCTSWAGCWVLLASWYSINFFVWFRAFSGVMSCAWPSCCFVIFTPFSSYSETFSSWARLTEIMILLPMPSEWDWQVFVKDFVNISVTIM